MADIILYPSRELPLDEFGLLGIGSFVLDYIIDEASLLSHNEVRKTNLGYSIQPNTGFMIKDSNGNTLNEYHGPYTPDNKQPGWDWNRGEKHNSGSIKDTQILEFIVGQNVQVRPGGGIINFARAWLSHSSEIPIGVTVLRGKGKRDDLIQGAFFNYIDAKEDFDPANIGVEPRTIVRGTPLSFADRMYFNPQFPFDIGTIVINSLESKDLTKEGIDFYLHQRSNGHYVGGMLAITPKMKGSYDLISRIAIPNGFIPIFSPTDLTAYAYRNEGSEFKESIMSKSENEMTYSEIFEAIKRVRNEQKEKYQRVYVTLGPFGAIGVGTSGTVYHVSVFNVVGDQFTGSGDVFASVIARFEHRKNLSRREYLPVYSTLAYASAASSLYIDKKIPSMGSIYNRIMQEKQLNYEILGTLDLIDEKSQRMQRKLSEVGNGPISGKYDAIKFRQ